MENELLAYIYALLSNDTQLTTNTGIDPATGSARAVPVFNRVTQDHALPYVRITITDTVLLDEEPFQYDYVPTCKTISLMVTAFSDSEPECLAISARLQGLLQHNEVTTTNFHGSTWLTSVDNREDASNPDRVYRMAVLRIRVSLEPR